MLNCSTHGYHTQASPARPKRTQNQGCRRGWARNTHLQVLATTATRGLHNCLSCMRENQNHSALKEDRKSKALNAGEPVAAQYGTTINGHRHTMQEQQLSHTSSRLNKGIKAQKTATCAASRQLWADSTPAKLQQRQHSKRVTLLIHPPKTWHGRSQEQHSSLLYLQCQTACIQSQSRRRYFHPATAARPSCTS
jgi:hypothetical protein